MRAHKDSGHIVNNKMQWYTGMAHFYNAIYIPSSLVHPVEILDPISSTNQTYFQETKYIYL